MPRGGELNALDYRIGFGFKGQDGQFYGPTGSIGLFHLGNDYYSPLNEPVLLQNTQLGLSGNTGNVGGPHVHVAKWKPGNVPGGYYVAKYDRTYFDPSDVKGITGTVSETGRGTDSGYFVRVAANNGYTYEFFHLNRIDVKVGDIIGDETMKEDGVRLMIRGATGQDLPFGNREIYEKEVKNWIGSNQTDFGKYILGLGEQFSRPMRARITELEKQLAQEATILTKGKYLVQ